MSNKLIIELEVPTDLSDKDACTAFLSQQLEYAVRVLKDNLNYYKEAGIVVPSISIRGLGKKKKEVDNEFESFKTTLLDLVLKYMPKVEVGQQIKAIKDLYALNKPVEHWVEMFESVRASYPLTTWYTVKHRLNQVKEDKTEESSFVRKELDEKEVNSIVERMKQYAKPADDGQKSADMV